MSHFISLDEIAVKELIKGGFAGFLSTTNLTLAYTDMKAGAEVPLHHHVEEAIDIILEGELEMQVGERTSVLRNGMVSIVPPDVIHRAKALSDCKVVTIFYPQRNM